MQSIVKKLPKSTLELTVILPKETVKEEYDELFKEYAKNTEIAGFRKGQAPEDVVKQHTDVSKLYGEVINHLLQHFYPQALKENHIQPVANPKVEIKEFDLEKEFEFVATIAVQPEVKIGDYKQKLIENLKQKTEERHKINAQKLKEGEKLEHDEVKLTADDVINAIVETSEVEIADILVEDETDRMITRLVDQAQAVGLSLEQYLKSHNRTADELRKDYEKVAEKSLLAEFAMMQLIKDKNITVNDSEIDQMINASGDENTREMLNSDDQKWYIRSIIAKNKLINQILGEVEKPTEKEVTS